MTQARATNPIDYYREIFDSRTPEELSTIARVKRFREWYMADRDFRIELAENPENAAEAFKRHDLEIDPETVRPLWDLELAKRCEEQGGLADWPMAKAWKDWITEVLIHRDMMLAHGATPTANTRFDSWRRRQMARAASELGKRNEAITHPIVAYELTKGCSVGCWFCAISAESFESHCSYTPENAAIWRDVLQTMVDLFGDASQTGFCYWATDPMDNPDYVRFIEDHLEITGWLPQTTTAAPLKDVALTTEVMKLFDRHRCVTNRFSISTPRLLKKVHETFTPDELLGVELVIHTKGSLVSKAVAGRVYERRERARAEGREDSLVDVERGTGTIACVSGFLVTMVDRKVRLVSPCGASERWPLGYRVYAEATFRDGAEYRACLQEMIESHMNTSLRGDDIVAFREDLSYEPMEDHFSVKSQYSVHKVSGHSFMRELGDLVARGDLRAGKISARLVDGGHNIFIISAVLQELFDIGLIEAPWPDTARRPAAELRKAS